MLFRSDPELRIDYIHGDQVAADLAAQPGNLGFFLPLLAKGELFPTVAAESVLPKKSFSMGEAEEKRFYMECRRIVWHAKLAGGSRCDKPLTPAKPAVS